MDSITMVFTQFHWLRPLWLLALLGIVPLFWVSRKYSGNPTLWQDLITPHLAKYLLSGTASSHRKQRLSLPMIWLMISVLSIIALAGPAWRKLPQPTERHVDALVIVLDLSLSMTAEDVSPSRIARARFKIQDILNTRQEGLTGLVVYAGNAHTVVPLTEDTNTISAMLPSLNPWLMPTKGNHPELALEKAIALLSQNNRTSDPLPGHIVLITDDLSPNDAPSIKKQLAKTAHKLSILGIGTPNGAPISLPNGQFLKDNSGQLVLPKFDIDAMTAFANATGSTFVMMSNTNADIAQILKTPLWRTSLHTETVQRTFDTWQDEGVWLIWLALPFAALLFRRGYTTILLLGFLTGSATLWPESASAGLWDNLWLNANQQAKRSMENNAYQEAEAQFTDPRWNAAAAYRNHNYQHTIDALESLNTATDHYNRGNALAMHGELKKALSAYDQALTLDPNLSDAQHNKSVVEKILKQQEQNQQEHNRQDPSQSNQAQDNKSQDNQSQDASGQNASRQDTQDTEHSQNANHQNSEDSSEDSTQSDSQTADASSAQDTDGDHNENKNDENNRDPDNYGPGSHDPDNPKKVTEQESQSTPDPLPEDSDTPQESVSQNESDLADLSKDLSQSPAPNADNAEKNDSKTENNFSSIQSRLLERIPDDPGGLLRRKFLMESRRQQRRPEPGEKLW